MVVESKWKSRYSVPQGQFYYCGDLAVVKMKDYS